MNQDYLFVFMDQIVLNNIIWLQFQFQLNQILLFLS